MQRKSRDYSKGKIYTMRSRSNLRVVYIGSTTTDISKRWYSHKKGFKAWEKDNEKNYCGSYEIIALGDAYCELYENYPCVSNDELERREGEVMRQFAEDEKYDCMNIKAPGMCYNEYKDLDMPNRATRGEYRHKRYIAWRRAEDIAAAKKWNGNCGSKRKDISKLSDDELIAAWESEEKRRENIRELRYAKCYEQQEPPCYCGEVLVYCERGDYIIGANQLYTDEWSRVPTYRHRAPGRDNHNKFVTEILACRSVCECGAVVKDLKAHSKRSKFHIHYMEVWNFIYS